MKVAYVVPRYGMEVVGGAEYACRMFAERLVAMAGWHVEVFTTCAQDSVSWADAYPADTVNLNGVTVHRFSSTGRSPEFHEYASRLLQAPAQASVAEAERFIDLQGPCCPQLVDAAAAFDGDLAIFYPYLYYPTVRGLPALGDRALMHPAAHDEPALRLPVFRSLFTGARGLVYQTEAERGLCDGLFPIAHHAQLVLGLGVETGASVLDVALPQGASGGPYVLYVGRVEDGKGTTMLSRFFAEYKARRPGPLKLVLAGNVVQAPPAHGDIVTLGVVSDGEKAALQRSALTFIQPSYFEAFSLSLLEAWAAGLPALVNGRCGPLREHCQRSSAGFWFTGYPMFEAALDALVGDAELRREMGANGTAYVEHHFRWPRIIERYTAFLRQIQKRRLR